jgi:cobalt/nickel transport system permease protein
VHLIDRNAQTNRWRRLPALEKVALALGMMILSLSLSSWLAQGLILGLMLLLLTMGARVPWRDVLRAATVPAGFILTSTVAQILTLDFTQGWPHLGFSPAAVPAAGFIGLRSIACVSALLLLALTTPLTDILRLLRRIGIGPEASDIALMMFRFIWLTLDCIDGSTRSQANRLGYSNYRRSLKSLGLLLAALLPRVLDRARRLENGLAARGYDGELHVAILEQKPSLARLGAVSASLIAIAVIARIAG